MNMFKTTRRDLSKKEIVAAQSNKNNYTWLMYVTLHCLDFALLEISASPLTVQQEKKRTNQMRNMVRRFLKTGNMTAKEFEIGETYASDHVAYMSQIMALLSVIDPNQLEWVHDEFVKLSFAAANRSNMARKKGSNEEQD